MAETEQGWEGGLGPQPRTQPLNIQSLPPPLLSALDEISIRTQLPVSEFPKFYPVRIWKCLWNSRLQLQRKGGIGNTAMAATIKCLKG